MKLFLFAILLAGTTLAASAQAPRYTTTPGSTLDYREVSTIEIMMNTPMGSFPVNTLHDGTVHLAFFDDDSLRAEYRSLELSMTGPDGTTIPDTGPVLDQSFVLHLTPDGRATTVVVPDFPEDVDAVTNLAHQFWDFFVPLPAEPLVDGLVWTDSLGTDEEGMIMKKVGRYEVVGDTTIGGVEAKVIRAVVDHRIAMELPAPDPGVMIVSVLGGTETGDFYFSVERGILIGRTRQAGMDGFTRIEGGPQPFEFEQTMSYSNTLEWMP